MTDPSNDPQSFAPHGQDAPNQPPQQPQQPQPGGPPVPANPQAQQGTPSYVTKIASVEEQVGRNVINALQHQNCDGVLTVVQPDQHGAQHIVSVPLTQEHMAEVQKLFVQAPQPSAQTDVPCVGFHCVLQARETDAKAMDPTNPTGG